MSDFLKKNLEVLAHMNPMLAAKAMACKSNDKFEVFTDSDPANINIVEKEGHRPLYSGKPVEETIKRIKSLEEYDRYPYLYFFGIGNGLIFKLLLGSNESFKRIVVIEPEIELLYIALHFSDYSKELASGRLILLHAEDINFTTIADLIAFEDAKIYSKLYTLELTVPYYNHHIDCAADINRLFTRAIEHQVLSVGNDASDSLIGLENHILNLPDMVKSPTVVDLVNALKNTPAAVIVSTGPSLAKQLPLLKELQDYITIVCIDASFPIMENWDIKPDIVVSLERIELTSQFYKKTPESFQEEVIFCITSIVHKELKDSITKGVKQFSMRPFGYTRFFELDPWGYAGIGMSAANMAFELVVHSGFKTCILIGQDLAYGEDGNTHSAGYVLDKDEFKASNDQLRTEAYGGQGMVRTNNIWKLFMNFFEKDIAHSKDRIEVFNCTEGGARIHGTIEMPFAEAAEKLIEKDVRKTRILLEAPSEEFSRKSLEKGEAKVREILRYGKEIQKEVEEVFLRVADTTEKLEKLNNEQKLEEIDFTDMQNLIDDIDNIKDYFTDIKFAQIFIDIIQSYIIHQELEIAKIMVSPVKEDIYKKAKMIDWIYAHKYWLFSLAGGIDAVCEVTRRSGSTWIKDL